MANELKHKAVGTILTQAEYEGDAQHVLDAQATGDIVYASSALQLKGLPIGAADAVLKVAGGIPSWSAVLAGLTLTAPVINGAVTTTGLTLPAHTAGRLALSAGVHDASATSALVLTIRGGAFSAGSGALIQLFGKAHANTGRFHLATQNVAGNADVTRLQISGALAIAEATWSNLTHTGIVLSGRIDAAAQFVTWTESLDSALVANEVSISGFEIAAGQRSLAISQENPVVVAAAGASDRYLPIRVNGVTEKLLLHS